MPTSVQFRRGTTAQNDAFTGADGELSIDTDKKAIRIHDNSTAGGEEVVVVSATQTLTNKTLTSAVLNTGVSGSAVLDEDDMSSNSATQLATQQSIKAYVDSQVTAQDLDVTSDSGTIAIDLDSETLTIAGGTGIDSSATTNTVTLAIDSTVTTLTGTQTLTNKTLTSPNLTSPTIGGTAIAEYISDTVGAMVTGNTESGISVTYDDADNTLDFDVGDFDITLTGAVTGSGTVTNLGNVSIATTNTADPTITLAGDLSGSATLTNLGSATLTATIAANSVALGTDTTGNYVGAGATSGNGISGSVSSEGGTFTVTSNATNSNTGSTIVFRDSSGNFSAGVITATTTAARYADLAERYTADADYEPGTVLVFGGEAEVTQATSKYDKRIAGIVSTDPAFLMNESLEDGVSVGLMGRVPCKVVGTVSKGQIMVSSATPGHAEAWHEEGDPPMGSVIGKALENKTDSREGVIEVVVGRM